MFKSMVVSIAVWLALGSCPAAADCINVYNKDEFDGKDRYFAFTSAREPKFGFVCDAETAKIRVLYKTGKKLNRKIRALPPWGRLAAIVDDQPARYFPGQLGQIDNKLVIDSSDASVIAFGKQIGGAQRRVLVAIEVAGDKRFRTEFPVAGSGAAIAKLFDTCAKIGTRRG